MSTKLIFFILFCTTGKRCNYTHTIMVFLHVSYFVSCSRTCAHCTVHIRTHTRAQSIKSTLFIVILLSFLIVEALMLSYSGNPNSEHGYERLRVCVCVSWNYEIHVIPQSGYWWICCKSNHYAFQTIQRNERCSIWLWWEIVMHKKDEHSLT